MKTSTASIVVCGWHFGSEGLFRRLDEEAERSERLEVRRFVASHRPEQSIDTQLVARLSERGWTPLFFENEGWDWGAYQQFARWQGDRGNLTDYYLFIHDDVEVKVEGLLDACLELADGGAITVGNSRPVSPVTEGRRLYPEDVLWAKNRGVEINSDVWPIVRGSCFFTSREVVETVLLEMPIKKGRRIELANGSLRIFGAMIAEAFGQEKVAYLSDVPRRSPYLWEEMRGGEVPSLKERAKRAVPTRVKKWIQRARGFQKVEPVLQGAGLKLNLGSGGDPLPGYLNVDMFSPIADVNADIMMVEFENDTVAEILIVHVIEHIEIDEIPRLLEKCFRWLKPGGQLILEFPDIIKCCRAVLRRRRRPGDIQSSPYGAQGLYGGNPKTSVYDLHKWGWTGSTMAPLLDAAGFSMVCVARARYHCPPRDTRVIGVK